MEPGPVLEKGHYLDPNREPLKKHTSNLANWLYILSFAPPCPNPLGSPRKFLSHPYVLYAFGTITSVIAGASLPGFDYLFGYWTNGIGNGGSAGREASPSSILARGTEAAWLATVLGVVYMLSFTTFVICCEIIHSLVTL